MHFLTPRATALAAVALLAATAQAQSSVTIFGTVDLSIAYSKAGGKSTTAMSQGSNIFPSRLGFRGVEDLGGGLSASFWLESALLPDSGELQGALFHRRSTVSLAHQQYGELRLGRDYTPTFWNVSQFSPFGTVGPGGSSNTVEGWPFGMGGARIFARANNSIGYFLPRGLGGFYGQVMRALDEGAQGTMYGGARLGYAAGPLDVAAAYGQTPTPAGRYKTASLGGTYDFGAAKLYANLLRQQIPGDRQDHLLAGVAVPVGVGVVKASLSRANRSGAGVDSDDATHVGLGYVHNLSKRTALYAMYGRVTNRGNAAYVVTDTSPAASPGGPASGLQLGISHNF